MKKIIFISFCILIIISIIKLCIFNYTLPNINEIYTYCQKNGYSTEYCFLTDFSKPSGIKRFYIYSFKDNKIIHKSLCAQGLGVNKNIFVSKFSNQVGSNYSSLGKYKVGRFRKMYTPLWFTDEGYEVHGLDATNSNALKRGILIHSGNLEFETFPLPCLPVSSGCFGVFSSMMKHIEKIKMKSNKPILLYAYN
ncbi:MAG: murein L,D-transpeptidase catalytic domain family protein [Bacteroidaceae bacterium]|nr:murein L,D-transpeptidase catalytic domain family protein [Bacteroidaceae bacterium]